MVELREIIALLGFLFGAILHLFLTTLVWKRKNKKPNELVFLFLVLSVAMWHAGNFLSLFSELLLGKRVYPLTQISELVAFVGLGFLPILLLHTIFSFLIEIRKELTKSTYSKLSSIPVVFYTPLIFFHEAVGKIISTEGGPVLEKLRYMTVTFISWFVVALVISAIFSFMLSRYKKGEREEHLYRAVMWTLIIIAAIMGYVFLLGGRDIKFLSIGRYLETLVMLSSIAPSLVLAYYIYKYNYMQLIIRRSALYFLLTMIVISIYLFLIRKLALTTETIYGVNSTMVEIILLLGLVFLFQPFKKKMQSKLDDIFFKDKKYYQSIFGDLIQTMNSAVDLKQLLSNIEHTVKRAMKIDSASVILVQNKSSANAVQYPYTPALVAVASLISYLEQGRAKYIDSAEVFDKEIIRKMDSMGASMILPIRRESDLVGLLCLGRKSDDKPFVRDEVEMLATLTSQLAIAIENAKLIQDKLNLEREVASRERLASLGLLAATIAHEVKNPLSSIKTLAQVMKESLPNDEYNATDLNVIIDEIDRLNRVVDQLLHFASPKKGEEKMVDLRETVEQVTATLRPEAKASNIEIDNRLTSDIPTIKADPLSLREIFFNIMLNSIQAMPQGGSLRIDSFRTDDYSQDDSSLNGAASSRDVAAGNIAIEIADTGPGIREMEIDKIFEPFYTTKQKGSGLGLTIVKQKMEEMSGTITVESRQGTKFTLYFPLLSKTNNNQGTNV